jgi:hypothetical protein
MGGSGQLHPVAVRRSRQEGRRGRSGRHVSADALSFRTARIAMWPRRIRPDVGVNRPSAWARLRESPTNRSVWIRGGRHKVLKLYLPLP